MRCCPRKHGTFTTTQPHTHGTHLRKAYLSRTLLGAMLSQKAIHLLPQAMGGGATASELEGGVGRHPARTGRGERPAAAWVVDEAVKL